MCDTCNGKGYVRIWDEEVSTEHPRLFFTNCKKIDLEYIKHHDNVKAIKSAKPNGELIIERL